MSVCVNAVKCHVAGKGITTWGTKFAQAKVLELASSSVVLVEGTTSRSVASGVLIAPNVLLCAAHSIGDELGPNMRGQLLFECDASTAPGVPPRKRSALDPDPPAPPPCTKLTAAPHMKLTTVLEDGSSYGLDYALVAITWLDSKVKLPRKVTLPKPDYSYGGELLAIGHQIDMSTKVAEATQASVGKHLAAGDHGPHPDPKTPAHKSAKEYTYTDIYTTFGMSGGGVFNEQGNLVGIVSGFKQGKFAFLNLGLAAGKTASIGGVTKPVSERLKNWMGGGQPRLSGDPQLAAGVTFTPAL